MFESIEAWASSATDDELSAAIAALDAEAGARERKRANAERHALALKFRRSILCPACGGRLSRDGGGRFLCRSCGARSDPATGTSLSSAKLPPSKIREIVAMVLLDCPAWVIAWIAEVDQKTARYWRDRCLDAAMEWSASSRLSGHVWIDEMQFAPTRAAGFVDGVWTTYAGRIASNAYLGVAVDSSGMARCRLYRKLGMPTKAMVRDAFADSIAPGSRLTHDGSSCHNLLVSSVPGLVDDWHKYVRGDREYEEAMRYMNLLCSYLRFEFEKHKGIKAAKIEAYATLFCYRFSHVRKHGLEASIDFLFGRVCGARKSHTYRESFRKGSEWSA